MKDQIKTREQLVDELIKLRKRIDHLETCEAEHQHVKNALAKSEERLNSFIDLAPDSFIYFDSELNLVEINRVGLELFPEGMTKEDIVNKNMKELYPDIVKSGQYDKYIGVLKTGKPVFIDEVVIHPKFGEVNIATSVFKVGDGLGIISTDITERKRQEQRIKQAAEEWRTTFNSISDLVSIHDKDFKITRLNKACADIFKMEPGQLIGQSCYEIFHKTGEPWPNCPFKQTFQTKKPAMEEFFDPHLGIQLEVSTWPVFNEKGEIRGVVHVAKDVTERRRMERQLIISDRLASIGQLASGVAHELNNPLTGVIGFSELLRERDVPDDIREDIDIVYSEAQRVGAVVKNLLIFSRKRPPVKDSININNIIEEVLAMRAYEERASNINVDTQFNPKLPEIKADYYQLQQVFFNIIINAEHSMIEAHSGGNLTITTSMAGDKVRICFVDDGLGISKENLGHVFDPFFTTKEVGMGTGLGLSVCHGIVSQHGGEIYVESRTGEGAKFTVELPIDGIDNELVDEFKNAAVTIGESRWTKVKW